MAANGNMREISLVLLTLQNYSQFILMRQARLAEVKYSALVAVVLQELIKTSAASLVLLKDNTWNVAAVLHTLHEAMVVNYVDFALLAVPAVVYTIQNYLMYVATENLDSATASVLYQLKILTTALFSVRMLGRRLSRNQWLSLLILAAGAALVQYSAVTSASAEGDEDAVASVQRQWTGLTAVLVAVVLSGFAGVWFEKMLKGRPVSLWVRNVQLGVLGIVAGVVGILASPAAREQVMYFGPLNGFTMLAWCVVLDVSLGGLLTAMVVKYADNIAKGFATSASIVLQSLTAVFFFGQQLTGSFMLGALLVILAAYLFSTSPPDPEPEDKSGKGAQATGSAAQALEGRGSPSPEDRANGGGGGGGGGSGSDSERDGLLDASRGRMRAGSLEAV